MNIFDLSSITAGNGQSGTGLAIRSEDGGYVFALAGTKYNCGFGELFYCGIGGHLEAGEDFVSCARREAIEEIGVPVELSSSNRTWYLPNDESREEVIVLDDPRPLMIYEMNLITPQNTRINYCIVIYEALLSGPPSAIKLNMEEVLGLLTLTKQQVIDGIKCKPTIRTLLNEGARLIASAANTIDEDLRCYPIGTAKALALILGAK